MKLYSVNDGPPSLACRMTLKYLNVPYEKVDVNFNTGEMYTDWYTKVRRERINSSRRKFIFN